LEQGNPQKTRISGRVLFQLSYCTEFSFRKSSATSATGTKDFSGKKAPKLPDFKGKTF
jgi:hypothetical protein